MPRRPRPRPRARRRRRRVASGYRRASTRCAKRSTGADTVFLIPAAEAADRVEHHRTAVDAAVAAGVPRIVYLSFLNAAPDATFTLARDHWATEEHIRAPGLALDVPADEPVHGLHPRDGRRTA